MPKLTFFNTFKNLGSITAEDIARWIPHPPSFFYIENYLANRIFYPQTIPQTRDDKVLELAILRAILTANGGFYYEKEAKFLIPVIFTERFPNLGEVVWAYLDIYKPKGSIRVFLKNLKIQSLGTVLIPEFNKNSGLIELLIENKKYSIKFGNLTIIPCPKDRCDITFFSKNAKILGKSEKSLEIFGGPLGIVVDARGGS